MRLFRSAFPRLWLQPHMTNKNQDLNKGGVKFDLRKPGMELLPLGALMEVARVYDYGATKYAPNNWRKGMAWSRMVGALLRHVAAWHEGEDLDPDTGLSHLVHAAFSVLSLVEFELKGIGQDDRPYSVVEELVESADPLVDILNWVAPGVPFRVPK